MREVILDTETTGLDFRTNRIIEIGAIEIVNKIPTGKKFHKYINPKMEVSIHAYKVHGISTKFLKDKPTFHEIAFELIDFLQDSKIVAHNAKFDTGFLNNEIAMVKKESVISSDRIICTMRLAAEKFPGSRINLNALCKRFNIDVGHRDLHGALLDAELLMKVYYKMTGYEQGSLLSSRKEKQYIVKVDNNVQDKQKIIQSNNSIHNTLIAVSNDENIKHTKMLEAISNSLWSNT